MRTLEFNLKEQVLSKDSSCDFSNIVSGTEGYLKAKFKFDKTWQGFGKVAVFVNLFTEYPALIGADGTCSIPPKALTSSKFEVFVIGKKDERKLISSSIEVYQERSKT